MTPEQFRQLAALAEAKKARDLADLEAAISEDRKLQDAIAEFTRTPGRELSGAGDAISLAQIALRLKWAEQNIARARKRRAELAGRIAELRKAAARSLGKHQALEELMHRAIREAAERKLSREEREAPPTEHRER